jgi:hypothetical protein
MPSFRQKNSARLRQKKLRERRRITGARVLRVTVDRELSLAINLASGAYGGSQEAAALDVLKRSFADKTSAIAAIRSAIGPCWPEIKSYLPYRGKLVAPGIKFTLKNGEIFTSERWATLEPKLGAALAIAARAFAQKDSLNIVLKVAG